MAGPTGFGASAFEAAVFSARNVHHYEDGDLFDVATAYCYDIAQAQASVDGNKRTAVLSGLVFFNLNGVSTNLASQSRSTTP